MHTPQPTCSPSRLTPLASAIAACLALSAMSIQAATVTVTNNNNSGGGSLRQAIIDTNAGGVADTINFAAGLDGQTISLSTGQMDISDTAPLIIDASALASGITVSGNNASRIFGVTQAETLTLNNLTVTAGQTMADSASPTNCATGSSFTHGGGICAEGDLELINTTISNSSTAGIQAFGGGFRAANTTLTNSTVSGNSTTGFTANGGGFFVNNVATLTNSTVSGNSTAGNNALGGGFHAYDTTLTNSTVSGNSTAGNLSRGGGFRSYDATLTNSTVTQNSANNASGDGIFIYTYVLSRTLTLDSTIISANGVDNVAVGGTGLIVIDANNSLFGDAGTEINGTDTNNIISNIPRLAALADNGCATPVGSTNCVQTHGLLIGSLALDTGTANGLSTDQRGMGFPRVINGQADIGAFEGIVAAPLEEDIPTLSIWMLGLLGLMLGFVARVKGRFN